MSFVTGTQAELLYTLNAAVTKNTYTTAAVFSAPAATAPVAKIQGGFLADDPNPVGRSFYLKAMGTIATTAAATFLPQIAFNQTAGTVSAFLATCYTATAPTAAITAQWNMEAWITCQASGETGGTTFQVNGVWDQSLVATGGALQSAAQWKNQFASNVTGLSSGVTNYVELVGTWSASAAGNTTTLQQMFLWGLN
jgi:hypothetical protein